MNTPLRAVGADPTDEDRRVTLMMEQEIAAPGLGDQYAIAPARRIGCHKTPSTGFRPITATPGERCDAALAVIERTG